MKGLEIGRIYYRKGSSNSEAIGHEIIAINNWLQSLPELDIGNSLHDEVNNLIKRLTNNKERLSSIIPDILLFARNNKLNSLEAFCLDEIKGIDAETIRQNTAAYQYRVQTVKISVSEIEINPYSHIAPTESVIKKRNG